MQIYPCIYYLPICALILTLKHIVVCMSSDTAACTCGQLKPMQYTLNTKVHMSLWYSHHCGPLTQEFQPSILVEFEFKWGTKGIQISGWFFSCFYWTLNKNIQYGILIIVVSPSILVEIGFKWGTKGSSHSQVRVCVEILLNGLFPKHSLF